MINTDQHKMIGCFEDSIDFAKFVNTNDQTVSFNQLVFDNKKETLGGNMTPKLAAEEQDGTVAEELVITCKEWKRQLTDAPLVKKENFVLAMVLNLVCNKLFSTRQEKSYNFHE